MMEIENEKRLWDGENSFKGSRMHQRQRIPQVFFNFLNGNIICRYHRTFTGHRKMIRTFDWTVRHRTVVGKVGHWAKLASKCRFSRIEWKHHLWLLTSKLNCFDWLKVVVFGFIEFWFQMKKWIKKQIMVRFEPGIFRNPWLFWFLQFISAVWTANENFKKSCELERFELGTLGPELTSRWFFRERSMNRISHCLNITRYVAHHTRFFKS